MARAAGCYSEAGIVATAKTVKAFMDAKAVSYDIAAGMVMVTKDEIWYGDESAAIREAFAELYPND